MLLLVLFTPLLCINSTDTVTYRGTVLPCTKSNQLLVLVLLFIVQGTVDTIVVVLFRRALIKPVVDTVRSA